MHKKYQWIIGLLICLAAIDSCKKTVTGKLLPARIFSGVVSPTGAQFSVIQLPNNSFLVHYSSVATAASNVYNRDVFYHFDENGKYQDSFILDNYILRDQIVTNNSIIFSGFKLINSFQFQICAIETDFQLKLLHFKNLTAESKMPTGSVYYGNIQVIQLKNGEIAVSTTNGGDYLVTTLMNLGKNIGPDTLKWKKIFMPSGGLQTEVNDLATDDSSHIFILGTYRNASGLIQYNFFQRLNDLGNQEAKANIPLFDGGFNKIISKNGKFILNGYGNVQYVNTLCQPEPPVACFNDYAGLFPIDHTHYWVYFQSTIYGEKCQVVKMDEQFKTEKTKNFIELNCEQPWFSYIIPKSDGTLLLVLNHVNSTKSGMNIEIVHISKDLEIIK